MRGLSSLWSVLAVAIVGFCGTATADPSQTEQALAARAGITALSGRVVTTDGKALSGVSIADGAARTTTDEKGRFLLADVASGNSVLIIDGRRTPARKSTIDYGYYEVKVDAAEARTTVLPFVSYLPRIDHRHDVTIASPTKTAVVVKTPNIPGLELRIPAGAIITDPDGKPVTRVGITRIPTDRTPFPLPNNVSVPVYFTAQPGGSRLSSADGNWLGAQVVYPNYRHLLPKARGAFWRYDPDNLGWTRYGTGTVVADASQVVPDKGTRIYSFTGAMFGGDPPMPGAAPAFAGPGANPNAGDPVDLGTGLFVYNQVDLRLGGTVPLALSRTYRPGDYNSRSFGVGTTLSYEMYLWSTNQYQVVDLVLADGGHIHYTRIPNVPYSNGWGDAVMVASGALPPFTNSRISWNGNGWNLLLQNGTTYVFGDMHPLQYIQDRYGNRTSLIRDSSGRLIQINSSDGRFIHLTNDSSGRILQSQDNAGRTVTYSYDTSGRLSTVTDPNSGVTTYGWDTSNRITTIQDANGHTFLTNVYDSNDRVTTQTLSGGGVYHFAYTLNGSGQVTETDVTDPLGVVRKTTFNSAGYVLTDNRATGTPLEQDITYTRDPTSSALLTKTDALGRETTWVYDANGNVTSKTLLAGTPQAVTTSYTYSSNYSQLASVTDPLTQTTGFTSNGLGQITQVTDPRGYGSSFTYDAQGRPLTVTDALSNTVTLAYDHGDLSSVTDPLGRTSTRFTDVIGRQIWGSDPLGNIGTKTYDAINGIASTTDRNGAVTTVTYNPIGIVTNIQDARGHSTTFTYDAHDRPTTRTDPLTQVISYSSYDADDNLLTRVDRKGQTATFTYDVLNRPLTATYADGSVVTYGWDAGSRLTSVQDSVTGTVTRAFDGLDRLTSETSPQGTISYTYDNDSRLATSTVTGQSTVTYSYDAASRVTQIVQSTSTVSFGYDNANRRTSATYPNGVVATYSYDAASELTGIAYAQGATTLGTLTYSYDLAGHQVAQGGTLFQSVLPAAVTSATYDANNRLTNWTTSSGSVSPTYDSNGNLTNDGSQVYVWDARNRLAGITGVAAFAYDPVGRRQSITKSGTTTSFLNEGATPVQESTGGTVTANLLLGTGIDERVTRTSGGATSTYLTNALGSTVALTDGTGAIQTSYGYDPYGNTGISGTATTSNYAYAGRENDGTGLYYNRARYYNPTWGRFISEDPIGFGGGINFYAYANGNPIQLTDPSGNFVWAIPVAIDLVDMAIAAYEAATAVEVGSAGGGVVAGIAVGSGACVRIGCIPPGAPGTASPASGSIKPSPPPPPGVDPCSGNCMNATSTNQMNQQVQRGQSPRGVTRVDNGYGDYEQDHIHFDDGTALNQDGSWKHDGDGAGPGALTKAQEQWILKNGWSLPKP